MKKSGYRTTFHIYLIFFLSLLGTILAVIGLFFLLITVEMPDGTNARSDFPKTFTEHFKEQITFIDDIPKVKQAGIEQLQDNNIGLQILDSSGYEVYSYGNPKKTKTYYTNIELTQLFKTGYLEDNKTTAFIGEITDEEIDYVYILHFPMEIKKVTMYLNGERFTDGKSVILSSVGILLVIILTLGIVYGFWTTKMINHITISMKDISNRSYLPVKNHGAFSDIYDSLNILDAEIRASDSLQEQTDKMRREWIANITHDLKTPLSPIKGYAEILQDKGMKTAEEYKRYAGVILKNTTYMENLIDDLKLTYQLENGMVRINREEQNIVRFLKELAIDILNIPEYENRNIQFESKVETILFSFDDKLLKRAFYNLIINAFVHGDKNTKVTLQLSVSENMINIAVSDNGKGMSSSEASRVFERYYRGTNTEYKPEGTGLGLAITKNIIEIHGGIISVSSEIKLGTEFKVCFYRN